MSNPFEIPVGDEQLAGIKAIAEKEIPEGEIAAMWIRLKRGYESGDWGLVKDVIDMATSLTSESTRKIAEEELNEFEMELAYESAVS